MIKVYTFTGLLLFSGSLLADSAASFSGSGFLTVAAGKMLGGTEGNVGDFNCPCFVSDYAQAAIFDQRNTWQWAPNTRLGLQGSWQFANPAWAITGQLVARASNRELDPSWLYVTYRLNNQTSLQFGRKRLPMFYYSDAQDIGFALPWTHLPTWLYGWQVVNYNGVNLAYQQQWQDWAVRGNVLVGREHRKDSGYWKVYGNGKQSITNVTWDNIVGGDVSVSNDWLELRGVYLQSNTLDQNINGSWNYQSLQYDQPSAPAPEAKQRIYGVALKADYENWSLFSELVHIAHPGLTYQDFAQIVSLSYRWQNWQPALTWGHYKGQVVSEEVLPNAPASVANSQQTWSLTLRYDIGDSRALKMQYDDTSDHSNLGFNPRYGHSRLLTFSYDQVF